MRKRSLSGVDFIPAGPTPPNPGELLSRPRFDEFIKLLRERYEYILLDTVPVQQRACECPFSPADRQGDRRYLYR